MIPEDIKKALIKQHYKIVGRHSGVKLCHWLKKSLFDEGFCYKQKFYGIESHRCLQMSPSLLWCNQSCIFCWRAIEYNQGYVLEDADEPEDIVEGCIDAQRKLLIGYKGILDRINRRKFEEAWNPKHAAISLIGEPTIYPRLSELIEVFHKRGFTTFLVTNGMLPEVLENLDPLPTQLYISVESYDKELQRKINRPIFNDAWSRLLRSLEIFSGLKTRRVMRITLIKGINMDADKFTKLIELAEPTYIETKAYMYVGYSKYRLKPENMPRHEEVLKFAERLSEATGYKIKDDVLDSRVVLLAK